MMVNVNGKIDVDYTELNAKFETLNTHVKKLETQVVQIWEAVKKQETFIKGKGDEALKYHVNAIIEDDFWQVVKEEKLQEGDFDVDSFMSFGSSHWCRPTSREEHQSMGSDEHRLMESVAACKTVRIMTHKEFAPKHPHPPKPFCMKDIDQQNEPVADR